MNICDHNMIPDKVTPSIARDLHWTTRKLWTDFYDVAIEIVCAEGQHPANGALLRLMNYNLTNLKKATKDST